MLVFGVDEIIGESFFTLAGSGYSWPNQEIEYLEVRFADDEFRGFENFAVFKTFTISAQALFHKLCLYIVTENMAHSSEL